MDESLTRPLPSAAASSSRCRPTSEAAGERSRPFVRAPGPLALPVPLRRHGRAGDVPVPRPAACRGRLPVHQRKFTRREGGGMWKLTPRALMRCLACKHSRLRQRYRAVLSSFRKHLSYSNVIATAALFIALGRYLVCGDPSRQRRCREQQPPQRRHAKQQRAQQGHPRSDAPSPRPETQRPRRRSGEGERARPRFRVLRMRSASAEQPPRTSACGVPPTRSLKAGVCIERGQPPGRLASSGRRAPVTTPVVGSRPWPQLDRFARTTARLARGGEWTSSVYRNPDNGMDPFDQLEAVVLSGGRRRRATTASTSPSSTPSAASLCRVIRAP